MRLGKCECAPRRRSKLRKFLLIHSVNDICVCVYVWCVCAASVVMMLWVVSNLSSLTFDAFLWQIVHFIRHRVNGKKWLMAVSAFSSQRAHFLYFCSIPIQLYIVYMLFSMLCTFDSMLHVASHIHRHTDCEQTTNTDINSSFCVVIERRSKEITIIMPKLNFQFEAAVEQGSKQSERAQAWQIRKVIKRCR